MKLHETLVIRCDDVGARCGDVCVWGSDVGDRAEVIRCDDIGAQTSALDVLTSAFGAATLAIARRSFDATILALDAEMSARRCRRSRGVTGDIGAEFPAISAIAELV